MFELNFMKIKPAPGFYKIGLQVTPGKADARLLGTANAAVTVKVTTQVLIENVEIGVADKEQSTSPRSTKVQHPQKAATPLEADAHQRVLMRFSLRDRSQDALMVAHQTFIRLTHKDSGREIIFVAEADGAKQYKFDLVCVILVCIFFCLLICLLDAGCWSQGQGIWQPVWQVLARSDCRRRCGAEPFLLEPG